MKRKKKEKKCTNDRRPTPQPLPTRSRRRQEHDCATTTTLDAPSLCSVTTRRGEGPSKPPPSAVPGPSKPTFCLCPLFFFFFLTGAHKLQSFGLAGTATKRAKGGYKATTASSWVKVKPLRAKSAAQIKTRRAPNADSNGR
ncbi:BQ5605_C042g12050 [Microbotryum silenes-dioicae]|uniref:BQ5605_C042g12050 protein n=1 Tax=Microbotryum silenes-dioicae TaxID=796604 RepID=A0A2X0MTI7_9BASI|nr:BQ5605_C042g12050 [Microbotryum silenes-dioicae]